MKRSIAHRLGLRALVLSSICLVPVMGRADAQANNVVPPATGLPQAGNRLDHAPLHPAPVLPDAADAAGGAKAAGPAASGKAAQPTTALSQEDNLRIAPADIGERTLDRIVGQTLVANGQPLGRVADLAVEPRTSKVAYVVVSRPDERSGQDELKLVDAGSVAFSNGRLSLARPGVDFGGLPSIDVQAFTTGQIAWRAGQVASAKRLDGAADPAALVRAASLRRKVVRSGDYDVGRVEEIAVDFAERKAMALVIPSDEFSPANVIYMVPISRLSTMSVMRDPIMTSLTRADFEHALPPGRGMDRALVPTGRTLSDRTKDLSGAHQPSRTTTDNEPLSDQPRETAAAANARAPVSAEPTLADATMVTAVQRALQNNDALAGEPVEVSTENGKIILRGSVRNELVRQKIATAARTALNGAEVENRLRVEP